MLIAAFVFVAGPAFAQSLAQECEDAGATDGVGLKFCTWEQDGLWHFDVKVISDAPETKAVSVSCQLPDTGMVQVIEDNYEPGADVSIATGTLPTSTVRPSSHCAIESVADWVPSDSHTEEQ
ncbi:MAG: hypothetical protein ABI399_12050 [Bauldia sp.]